MGMEEDSGCSGFFSNLLCQEDETCLDGEEEEERGERGGFVFVKDSDLSEADQDEYIRILVSRESGSLGSHGGAGFSHSDASTAVAAGDDWLKCTRSGAVRWILKARACFGFSHRTAYLSVIYLDRFFVKRTIEKGQSWAIQLLSLACLSLAAKMEERRVPPLTEYPVQEYHFDGKAIQRMELLVLNTLEWRMSSITPFLYLNYFASKFGGRDGVKDIYSRSVGFIFSAVEAGMNLVDCRPSAVAAAAIFAASGQPLTKALLEDKMGAISTCRSLELDHTLSCYNVMMQESQRAQTEQKPHRILVPTAVTSSSCPSLPSSGDDHAIDDSCLSALCCKRRKLAMSSYACNCRISNKNNNTD